MDIRKRVQQYGTSAIIRFSPEDLKGWGLKIGDWIDIGDIVKVGHFEPKPKQESKIKIGREFEFEAQELLKKNFDKVIPIFLNKARLDFEVWKGDRKYFIECKNTRKDSISLAEKDLKADFIMIKNNGQVYVFKKVKEWQK